MANITPQEQIAGSIPGPPDAQGERIVPTVSCGETSQEHAARYVFAADYCSGKDVLDVASGFGYGTDYLRMRGAKATGLEIHEPSVRYARAQYALSTYTQGSAEHMPANWSESYDVIVSFETIEHLGSPGAFLGEVFRCLRPNGLFICSTPNKTLTLVQSGNPFHVKEFYHREFVRFVNSRLRVRSVFGQIFHRRGRLVFTWSHALARKVLRAFHVPPLGISTVFSNLQYPSPFNGDSIDEDKVLPEFMPSLVRRGFQPSFIIVVAEKIGR